MGGLAVQHPEATVLCFVLCVILCAVLCAYSGGVGDMVMGGVAIPCHTVLWCVVLLVYSECTLIGAAEYGTLVCILCVLWYVLQNAPSTLLELACTLMGRVLRRVHDDVEYSQSTLSLIHCTLAVL